MASTQIKCNSHIPFLLSIFNMKKYSKNKYCFASEFAAARLEAGFSLAGAAKICGRSVRSITDWEAGRQPVPAWALRLIVLESRYMEALYGLQADRGRTGFALGLQRSTMAANDDLNAFPLPASSLRLYASKRSYMPQK
jgi:DNA-binding transcriptional regulator YiaG